MIKMFHRPRFWQQEERHWKHVCGRRLPRGFVRKWYVLSAVVSSQFLSTCWCGSDFFQQKLLMLLWVLITLFSYGHKN